MHDIWFTNSDFVANGCNMQSYNKYYVFFYICRERERERERRERVRREREGERELCIEKTNERVT